MKILLIPSKSNYPDPRPCLDVIGQGLPYIAGALKDSGYEVFGETMNYQWCHGGAPLVLEKMLRETLHKIKPDIVGLSGLSADFQFIRDAILFIRTMAPGIKVVLGGGIITYDDEFIFNVLKPDYALAGDAEENIVMLIKTIEDGGSLDAVPNLLYWKEGEPVLTERKPLTHDLDSLSYPDYDLFRINDSFRMMNQADNFVYAHTQKYPRILPITLGRSCPFNCTFCCHHKTQTYRSRSIESALDEMVFFHEKYQYNLLFVYDELFSLKKERIQLFCEGINRIKKEYGIDFHWTCALRVNGVNKDILEIMKASGCIFIGYGIESGSQQVLDSMNKQITVSEIKRVIRLTEEAGIGVQGNFILGDIAETENTINETVNFYNQYKNLMFHFGYVTPYPGSRIFQHCIDHGIICDKSVYYECIGQIGNRIVNMTAMSDDDFDNFAKPLLGSEYLSLISSPAKSCVPIGPSPADCNAPIDRRRTNYEITVACPFCSSMNEYLYPLHPESLNLKTSFPHYCASCHKRYSVDLRSFMLLPHYTDDILGRYEFNGSNVYTKFESYRGYNLIHHFCKIYAVPQIIGAVNPLISSDMRHPDIIIATDAQEARNEIDHRIQRTKMEN